MYLTSQIIKTKLLTFQPTIPGFNDPKEKAFKTLWEKEKMLVTSIFSFSHTAFYPIKNEPKHMRGLKNEPKHMRGHLLHPLQMLSIWWGQKFCCLIKSLARIGDLLRAVKNQDQTDRKCNLILILHCPIR